MKTRVVTPPDGIAEAARLLVAGDIVGLPTETVYGLGADALDPLACARVFEAKERPLSDPLIAHLPNSDWLDQLAHPNDLAILLAKKFWPGPLTMVLPRKSSVPDILTAGQDNVALRMSAHPIFRKVAELFGKPIAAPSANRFGRISPTCADHVKSELDGRIPLILDGGPCVHGIESTIVLVHDDGLEILRPGPITEEQLLEFGEILKIESHVSVPGGMKSHYAPQTPLCLLTEEQTFLSDPGKRVGLLSWKGVDEVMEKTYFRIETLSPVQDLREAAANLYGAMRRLDEAGLDLILAEPVPEMGLGIAIMERLRKAAASE